MKKPYDYVRIYLRLVLTSIVLIFLCTLILGAIYIANQGLKAWNVRRFSANATWVKELFPYTDEPDQFNHRLQRIDMAPIKINGKVGSEVVCRFIYPDFNGSIKSGKAKFFLPPKLAGKPNERVPLIHVAGYEIESRYAMAYLEKDMAVVTVFDDPLPPMARGPKMEWALMHAERRLSFVDDSRVMIFGKGQGGYISLMMAAETVPMVCAVAIDPVVNWAYNATYFERSKAMSISHRLDSDAPWLPGLARVMDSQEMITVRFGSDTESDVYFELSPVSWADAISGPVAIYVSTADVISPINQVNKNFVIPFNAENFPKGYKQDMDTILSKPGQRVRLYDILGEKINGYNEIKVPEEADRYMADGRSRGKYEKSHRSTYSYGDTWHIYKILEGAPEPQIGHRKYAFDPNYDFFVEMSLKENFRPNQLTLPKLKLLMKRYLGIEPRDFKITPAGGSPYNARLLDFPQAERADVLRGLITYARQDEAAALLGELYSKLPPDLKAFGSTLGDGTPVSVRQALEALTDSSS